MRIVVGSLFLAGAALLGGGKLPAVNALFETSNPVASETLVAADPAVRGPVFQTIAVTEQGPEATTAASTATAPSVVPVTTAKAVVAHGKHAGKGRNGPNATVTRPGYKLSCAASQKFDTARRRCVPLKGTATATLPKPRA